jgi:predicted dehydrogenase/GNAT superfamily N-acetyltransferase
VQACIRSRGTYMMAENYTYMRPNVLVRELARQGLFGEVYYAEGEYLHDVTDLAERTTWRRHWQVGIDGVTYPTHSLGPIVQWMPGDRVTRVSCEGSGHHYRDPRGEEYHQDTSVMLCKTARGALIKIRLDLVSARPHAMTNYQLQGTTGAYESSRGGGERGKLWLRQLSEEVRWHDFTSLMEDKAWSGQYLPELWRNPPPELLKAGHGGGDYFEVLDFINAVRGVAPCPIGIHEAMDMTLPGLISQQSITRAGAWMDVPDTRRWEKGLPQQQLVMEWPEGRPVPSAPLPAGYELRQYTEADEAAYIELMDKAGFTGWTPEQVRGMIRQVLPDGFFLVVHRPTGRLVATTVSIHRPTDRYPYGGELGWVAGDSEHKGKGLGMVVCAAATARLLQAGYRRIYLQTDDFRLPALKTYLKLGYRPDFSHESMEERWRRIYEALGWSGG